MADATDLKSVDLFVWVRVPSPVPIPNLPSREWQWLKCLCLGSGAATSWQRGLRGWKDHKTDAGVMDQRCVVGLEHLRGDSPIFPNVTRFSGEIKNGNVTNPVRYKTFPSRDIFSLFNEGGMFHEDFYLRYCWSGRSVQNR